MKTLQIIGHLGKDATVLEKKQGQDFFTINFSVAHSETYIDKDGKEQTRTDWISCFKRYKKDPKDVLKVLKKGLKVYVDGVPTFGMQSNGNGVYCSITLNVRQMEFMSKKEGENE